MLTIFKCPMRVSLFGGGSDYREYYKRRPGAVIGFSVDKYTYLVSAQRSNIEDYNFRLAYNKLEMKTSLDEIEHPLFRKVLAYYGYDTNFDFSLISDLPARSGLSSSSALAVCLAMYLNDLREVDVSKLGLARQAILFERDILQELGGIQDQLHCAFGGFNRFDFFEDNITQKSFSFNEDEKGLLNRSFILVSTRKQRFASEVLTNQVENTKSGKVDTNISEMVGMVDECESILTRELSENSMMEIGTLLQESWRLKKSLSKTISNSTVDQIVQEGLNSGAYGAKLCGAGSGGFVLFVIPESGDARERVLSALNKYKPVKLSIDYIGPSNVRF